MGKEVAGAVRVGSERHKGKILLESSELLFRGTNYRVKITFGEMRSVTASPGELRVETQAGTYVFEVGGNAEKWREKILHPKSRAEKLGVKERTTVRLVGEFEADFIGELRGVNAEILPANNSKPAANVFFAANGKNSSGAIAKQAKKLKGPEALWIVYAKGKKELTESDVIAAGRKAGLKDVKVVGFSATHTALKFVIPVDKR
jgi:hypothetical protein